MIIKGIAKKDKKTKILVKRLETGNIAVIDHMDLDEIAVRALLEKKIKAVININRSISGAYPNLGPGILVQEITLLDQADPELWDKIQEDTEIEIRGDGVYANEQLLGRGILMSPEIIQEKMAEINQRLPEILTDFVDNTLDYAKNEIELITDENRIPDVATRFAGRQALIVVRGHNYKEDLQAIRSYIREMKPLIIGVDGGADAIMEFGYKPDMIIGDMDSVSDDTLRSGAEIVVHAYVDGRAPGLERLAKLGLNPVIYCSKGTSEDIAMLLAYHHQAKLIVAVGAHSNMVDFLEKGRKGMASTFLVRLKVGSMLIDAKGVNQLYGQRVKAKYLFWLILAAILPVLAIILVTPATKKLVELLLIQFRIMIGF